MTAAVAKQIDNNFLLDMRTKIPRNPSDGDGAVFYRWRLKCSPFGPRRFLGEAMTDIRGHNSAPSATSHPACLPGRGIYCTRRMDPGDQIAYCHGRPCR